MCFSFRTENPGPSPGLRRLQESDAAQIAGDHPEAQPAFHPLSAMIAAFAPAIVAPQTGNPPLNPCSPPIAAPKGGRAFPGSTLLRCLAHRRNRHLLDPCGFELLLRIGSVDSTISGHQPRRPSKHLLMMSDRINGLPVLLRMFQDLIARHQPAFHLVYGHQPPKFHERTALVARN